jgi:hypothetical protein
LKDDYGFSTIKLEPNKEILLALEKKVDNINHLKLLFNYRYKDRILQKILPKFHKLKMLMMDFWSFNEEQLKMCVYHDLEIFGINHYELKKSFHYN